MITLVALTLTCGLFWSAQGREVSKLDESAPEMTPVQDMLRPGGPGVRFGGQTARGRHGGAEMLLRLREELSLDESQVGKIKEIRLQAVKEASEAESGLKVAGLELRDLLDSENVDLKKVEDKVREVSNLRGEVAVARVRARVRTLEVLSPEQREKLSEIREERVGEHRRMRPGPDMRRGPGGWPGPRMQRGLGFFSEPEMSPEFWTLPDIELSPESDLLPEMELLLGLDQMPGPEMLAIPESFPGSGE